jgi:hypothetical protein
MTAQAAEPTHRRGTRFVGTTAGDPDRTPPEEDMPEPDDSSSDEEDEVRVNVNEALTALSDIEQYWGGSTFLVAKLIHKKAKLPKDLKIGTFIGTDFSSLKSGTVVGWPSEGDN